MKVECMYRNQLINGTIIKKYNEFRIEFNTTDLISAGMDLKSWSSATYETGRIRQYGDGLKASFGHTSGKWDGVVITSIKHKSQIVLGGEPLPYVSPAEEFPYTADEFFAEILDGSGKVKVEDPRRYNSELHYSFYKGDYLFTVCIDDKGKMRHGFTGAHSYLGKKVAGTQKYRIIPSSSPIVRELKKKAKDFDVTYRMMMI